MIKGIFEVTSAICGMTPLIAASFRASLIETMIAPLELEDYWHWQASNFSLVCYNIKTDDGNS